MTLRAARRLDGIERTLIRQIFDAAPADAINLGLGQPDLPTPDVVALAPDAAVLSPGPGLPAHAGIPQMLPYFCGPVAVSRPTGCVEPLANDNGRRRHRCERE